jgi:hypothetical protein
LAYFVFVGAALAVGAGAAAAGDGLATGLGLVAGAVVSPAGVVAGDAAAGDDAGVGEFELLAGSQAAANAITRIVVNKSTLRLIDFKIGLLIVFPRSNRIEKRADDCPNGNCQQWVFPQALRRGLRLGHTEALVYKRVALRTEQRSWFQQAYENSRWKLKRQIWSAPTNGGALDSPASH